MVNKASKQTDMENWPILSINLIMKKARKHSSFMRCRSNNQIKSTFETNQLQLPPTIRIEIRGQERKKTFFIFALFSTTAEARTFESPTAEVRRRGVSKLKTNRMEPSNYVAKCTRQAESLRQGKGQRVQEQPQRQGWVNCQKFSMLGTHQ